jgi:Ca2+/Na+ antiporter
MESRRLISSCFVVGKYPAVSGKPIVGEHDAHPEMQRMARDRSRLRAPPSILVVAALPRPLVFQLRLLRFELPLVVGISVGLWCIAWDSEVGHIDGIVMFAAFTDFVLFMIRSAKRESCEVKQEIEEMAVAGIGLLAKQFSRRSKVSPLTAIPSGNGSLNVEIHGCFRQICSTAGHVTCWNFAIIKYFARSLRCPRVITIAQCAVLHAKIRSLHEGHDSKSAFMKSLVPYAKF